MMYIKVEKIYGISYFTNKQYKNCYISNADYVLMQSENCIKYSL